MNKLKYTEDYLDATWFSFKETYFSINNTKSVVNAFAWDSLVGLCSKFVQAYSDNEFFEGYNLHLLGILTNRRDEKREEEEEEWDED